MKVGEVITNQYGIEEDTPHFGIEIEVENVIRVPPNVHDTSWVTTADGSLRGGGVEFLSRRPVQYDVAQRDICLWYDWLSEYEWQTNIRTSIHVHVNVLGRTFQQVAASSVLYTLVEPLLFRYCGPVREENIYCVPWYRARDELYIVRAMHSGGIIADMNAACKYSALYLEPVLRFGTLEFRQAPVFETADELLNWVKMCEFITYSEFDTIEEVLDCFRELGPDQFVEKVFGPGLTRVLRDACDKSFEELMDEYDVETSAEITLSSGTDQTTPSNWFAFEVPVEGNGHLGYHNIAQLSRGRMSQPHFYEDEMVEPNYDEDYYDEEEY